MVLLAKPNESLLDHTLRTIRVLSSMRGLRPVHNELAPSDLHETVALALALHDAGKAATGFQSSLTGRRRDRWGYRHEILSAALLSCLSTEDLPNGMERACALAILSHHKDLDTLWNGYSTVPREGEGYRHYSERLVELRPNIAELVETLRRVAGEVRPTFPNAAATIDTIPDPTRLENQMSAADPFADYVRPLRVAIRKRALSEADKRHLMLLKGIVTSCDHLASSGVDGIRQLSKEMVFCKHNPNPAQLWSSGVKDSAILVAPTGLGKTEAALLWARHNLRCSERLFYLLPTTASINKMYERLRNQFSRGIVADYDLVSMLHHRSAYYLYRYYSDEDYLDAGIDVKALVSNARMLYSPVKVTTPFQPLKGIFGVRGYERMVSELAGSLVVVDEIHAYDPHVTGLILTMLSSLSTYGARFFLMSATFPRFLMGMFQDELAIPDSRVRIDQTEDKRARHRVLSVDGPLDKSLDEVVHSSRETRTLVICNTVNSAIKTYEYLRGHMPDKKAVLLHGRFALTDRVEKERTIADADFAVATQAVEVSLDISYDQMFTEPAPIDALLQRFGRVNRWGQSKHPARISVFNEGGRYDNRVYKDYATVERTLEVLHDHGETLRLGLTEKMSRDLVEEVYSQGFSEKQQEMFASARDELRRSWNELLPLEEGDSDEFYDLFESIDVVPAVYERDVRDLHGPDRLRLPEYLVGVPVWAFRRMEEQNLVKHLEDYLVVDVPYSKELGLRLDQLSQLKGGGDAFVF